jgi:peptidoglycan/xylan/chitin deacetylase (PgdA/CDA1 family)
MFISSDPFAFFDYFRVPYEVDPPGLRGDLPRGVGRLHPTDREDGSSSSLYWWRAGAASHQPWRVRAGRYTLAGFSIVCPVLRDPSPALSRDLGPDGRWEPVEPIQDLDGEPIAWVWADGQGSVFLPFDPGEAMGYLWSERYTRMGLSRWTGAVRNGLVKTYYAVRPLLPREVQIRLRQGYAAHLDLPDFPGWPAEHSLHDMYDWLWGVLASVAGQPVPYLSPWPAGKDAAFVLTHDVETDVGRDSIEALRSPERELGLRSSWNFVPERYDVPDELVRQIKDDGCEVGVHGLRHDGQDLASRRKLSKRLPAMREYADRWGAVGFRSPATQRHWKLMPTMGFDYDSSYHDTAPHEPQPGGSCTYLPFFNDDLVELPMTLPMDHTIFEILGHSDGTVWKDKAEEVRRRGGMVLVLVHPDYVTCPGLLEAWRALLAQLAGDERVWHALPREVSDWWRRRARSGIERRSGTWAVQGPAADEAEVRFGGAEGREHGASAFMKRGKSHVDHSVTG